MSRSQNNITKGLLGAGALLLSSTVLVAPVQAETEVSASVSVANMYLWRGLDLGNGDAAVSGDLQVSDSSGLYAGIWGSSGDSAAGNEYDLYIGFGGEANGFSYDLSVWNYIYPSAKDASDDFGNLSEAVLSLGYGPVTFSYYDNIAGNSGNSYYNLSFSMDAFSVALGKHDDKDDSNVFTHVDLGYAYNDNLGFTLSQIVDEEVEGSQDKSLKFVVSYSLPIQ